MTPDQERLSQHLRRLNLHRIEQVVATVAEEATKTQLSDTDFLTQLLEAEVETRYERTTLSRIRLAHFPFTKTLADFDFSFQPSIDQKQLKELAQLRFIDQGENVIFLGPPGVGKTHLAVALGMKAAEAGYRVLCTTTTDLVTTLAKAWAEHRFEERLKLLCQPQLLIIDEIGYLPLDKRDATYLFQLVSRRDERGSIILTSNKAYSDWGAIFAGDSVIASAILDRLLHHSTTINITGESYRLKDKRRAGLIQPFPTLPEGGDAMAYPSRPRPRGGGAFPRCQWVHFSSLTTDGFLLAKRYLIHDRDTKYTHAFDALLKENGVEPIRLPPQSPNLNAYSERFVRSIKEEALEQMVMLGERSLSYAIQQYLAHYHHERNHQGLGNQRIAPEPGGGRQAGAVVRRDRLGGLLSYYYRDAA